MTEGTKLAPRELPEDWVARSLVPFEQEMIAAVEAHKDDRGDWRIWSPVFLAWTLIRHVGELAAGAAYGREDIMRKEAVDIANLALMVFDAIHLPGGEPRHADEGAPAQPSV